MQFSLPRKPHKHRENIVPMINVVFLLLIFFLVSAQIAPPEPFAVIPPKSDIDASADGLDTLYIDKDGLLAFGNARGDAVFLALAERVNSGPLLIRADRNVAASKLAALLPKIAKTGITDLSLITEDLP